jgi:hypothetical protein
MPSSRRAVAQVDDDARGIGATAARAANGQQERVDVSTSASLTYADAYWIGVQ